jgi:uncharacterized BrkB/YihY/UPF0761 family membrane protein
MGITRTERAMSTTQIIGIILLFGPAGVIITGLGIYIYIETLVRAIKEDDKMGLAALGIAAISVLGLLLMIIG